MKTSPRAIPRTQPCAVTVARAGLSELHVQLASPTLFDVACMSTLSLGATVEPLEATVTQSRPFGGRGTGSEGDSAQAPGGKTMARTTYGRMSAADLQNDATRMLLRRGKSKNARLPSPNAQVQLQASQ